MELYNFFTEVVSDDKDIEHLKQCMEELTPICHHVHLVKWKGITGVERYSIIGQMYGEDTNFGDTDLMCIFMGIKYTWFDAYCPAINNIK